MQHPSTLSVQGHLDSAKHISTTLILIHVIYTLQNGHVQQVAATTRMAHWQQVTSKCEHGSVQVTPTETLRWSVQECVQELLHGAKRVVEVVWNPL